MGYYAGLQITTGSDNLILGSQVGELTLTSGSNNIPIGTGNAVETPAAGTNNFLNIGNLIYGTSIGTAASPGNVGIGSTSPQAALDINGSIDIRGINGLTLPSTDTNPGASIAIGNGALAHEGSLTSGAYGNI